MGILTDTQLATFNFGRALTVQIPAADEIERTLQDLSSMLGKALIVDGIAVIHHGYERTTKDVDVLYAYRDGTIMKRLSPSFKVVKQSSSGWHHLEHRTTGVRLELVPEGGLTTYGFIPGPDIVGGKDGIVSLLGLVWLKLVSGKSQDDADIVSLAKVRAAEMKELGPRLPQELRERFARLLEQAKREMASDPYTNPDTPPPDPKAVQEMEEKYGPKAPGAPQLPQSGESDG
jgi:hypothetical protein